MSAAAADARRRTVIWMAGAALIAVLFGAASFLPPKGEQKRAEVGRLVLPDFASKTGRVGLIMVTTSEESYHIVRNGDQWVLAEKGSYPVRPDRIFRLADALSHIRFDRPMTREEKKFDRIGLGDPLQGGTGALLEVSDGSGEIFARLIVGYRDGHSYVREPDDLQAWSVAGGDMPPLQRGARWLDLDVISISAADIADVQVRPARGPAYRLLRSGQAGQQFGLAPPYAGRRLSAPYAPTLTALALSRFSPIDVAPANAIASGAPIAQHVVRTGSGLTIIAKCWRSEDRDWVTIGAAAAEDAPLKTVADADAINSRAAGWAFALTELDWRTLTTPLAELVE